MTYHRGTLEEFNRWHENAMAREGITPEGRIGYVKNKPAPEKQRTMRYSEAIAHPKNSNDYIWIYGKYMDDSLRVMTPDEAAESGWLAQEEFE